MCSKVGIVVVLSSLHSSHHCPAAVSCHRYRLHLHCRLRTSIQLTPVAQCRCRCPARLSQDCSRMRSPSTAGPLPQQQPPHSSRVALHPAPVSQRVRLPCEGFEGDSAGQDRLLIQCRVCEASCLKVVQFSAPTTYRFELLVFACVGLFSLSFYVPPLQLLLTIAHELLPSGSLCNLALQPRSFRGVCFSVRPPPQQLTATPPKPLPLACAVSRRESLSIVAPLFTCFPLRTL